MKPVAVSIIAAFTVGLIGFLLVAMLRLGGGLFLVGPVLVGVVAGLTSQRAAGLLGLVAGIVAFYPIALWLRLFAFLGEVLEVGILMDWVLAAVGFIVALVVRRATSRGASGP